jgi:Ca-activated chloride channel homolog
MQIAVYVMSEIGFCLLLVIALGVVIALLAGFGYLLKLFCTMLWRKIEAADRRRPVLAPARRALSLALIAVLLASAHALAQQSAPKTNGGDYTVNVSVDEVVLHATVRNARGTPVAGLSKDDFQVFEDKIPQAIKHFSHNDIPVTVGLVIDNSGSMRPKRAEVIAAALAFAGSSNPQDQMFLVNFNEHVSLGLPSNKPFTDQQNELKAAMATVISAGKTALYDAVILALEHLKKGNRDKKVLVVVSDGADNASTHTKAQMLELARRSEAIIYPLGIYEPGDPDVRDPRSVKELAKATGGESFFPDTLKDVLPVCEHIAHEIRNQYTISYIPTNHKQDGTYRTIQVRATSSKGNGLAVITRSGYTAPIGPATANAGAITKAQN